MTMNHSEAGKLGREASRKTQEANYNQRLLDYSNNPKLCGFCKKPINYNKRDNDFCSQSCACRFNNNRNGTGKQKLCPCGAIANKASKHCKDCIALKKHTNLIQKFEDAKNDACRRRFLLRNCPHKCEICGIEEWQGQPTPLIMDHIDGHSENNDRSNFRLVCPNCDAQLPTYKAKNKGNGRASRRERYKDGKSF